MTNFDFDFGPRREPSSRRDLTCEQPAALLDVLALSRPYSCVTLPIAFLPPRSRNVFFALLNLKIGAVIRNLYFRCMCADTCDQSDQSMLLSLKFKFDLPDNPIQRPRAQGRTEHSSDCVSKHKLNLRAIFTCL